MFGIKVLQIMQTHSLDFYLRISAQNFHMSFHIQFLKESDTS